MEEQRTRLQFGSGSLRDIDPEKHRYLWGARLIWDEVIAGSTGIVWDRTDTIQLEPLRLSDAPNTFTLMVDNAFTQFLELIRREVSTGRLGWGDGKTYGLWHGTVYTCGGPQGSYGYLYVTQAVYKPDAMPGLDTKVVDVSTVTVA